MLTVGELKKHLAKFSDDLPVTLYDPEGDDYNLQFLGVDEDTDFYAGIELGIVSR
jgi:hypothetical protein